MELVLSTLRSGTSAIYSICVRATDVFVEDEDFARDAATVILATFTTNEQAVNTTFIVIIGSLVADYGGSVSVSQASSLDALSGALRTDMDMNQLPSGRILLAIVRAASQCDGPVSACTERVKK
ncbi:unnamed protein product [Peniophora sp. CBMAI 1063]|nr:unnamed protein product [Peniophora sp. CBMAI 1063]